MTRYGFRLHKVQIFDGRKQTALGWQSPDVYVDEFAEYLALCGEEGVEGYPTAETPDDLDAGQDEQPTVTKRFAVVEIPADRPVPLIKVRYGVEGAHDKTLPAPGSGQQSLDISGHAPTRVYRVMLIPPSGAGTTGLLAVEAISRSSPTDMLVRWMNKWAKDDAAVTKGTPYRLKAEILADTERLDRFFQGADVERVQLTAFSFQNNRRSSYPIIMSAKLSQSSGIVQDVLNAVKGWGIVPRRTPAVDKGEAARAVATEVMDLPGEGLVYDDVEVEVRAADGSRKVIRPSRLADTFTYDIEGDSRPNDPDFVHAVRAEAQRVATAMQLDLDL